MLEIANIFYINGYIGGIITGVFGMCTIYLLTSLIKEYQSRKSTT